MLRAGDMHTNAGNFVGDVNAPRNTPFKSVFIATDNEAHVFMSQGLLTFARNEIVANTKVSCGGMIMADPVPVPREVEGALTPSGPSRILSSPTGVRTRGSN